MTCVCVGYSYWQQCRHICEFVRTSPCQSGAKCAR